MCRPAIPKISLHVVRMRVCVCVCMCVCVRARARVCLPNHTHSPPLYGYPVMHSQPFEVCRPKVQAITMIMIITTIIITMQAGIQGVN